MKKYTRATVFTAPGVATALSLTARGGDDSDIGGSGKGSAVRGASVLGMRAGSFQR